MGEWPGSGAKLSPSGLRNECGARRITSEQELQLTRNATSQLSNYVTLFLAAQLEAVGCGTKVVVKQLVFLNAYQGHVNIR